MSTKPRAIHTLENHPEENQPFWPGNNFFMLQPCFMFYYESGSTWLILYAYQLLCACLLLCANMPMPIMTDRFLFPNLPTFTGRQPANE